MASCSQLAFWKTPSNEEVAKAEEHLAQTIDVLMMLDPVHDGERYYESRARFEEALELYLLVTGKRDRTIIHLDYKGTNIIIPVRRIEHFDDQVQLMQTGTARTIWQRIGPVFQDEIVDVAVVHMNNNRVKIAALFADSLVVFSPQTRKDGLLSVGIPSHAKQNIRSRIPAGMIAPDTSVQGNRIYFLTAHSDTSFLFDMSAMADPPHEYAYPVDVRPVTGRPFFEYYNGGEFENVFGVRHIQEDSRTILLDDRGMLHVFSNGDGSHIWKSDRPWGNRLFRIDKDKFVVPHPDDNSFILFNMHPDTVVAYGASPRFHGSVGAVTYTILSGVEGYIVGITTGDRYTGWYSQLHFIPDTMMHWRDAEEVPHPLFPDYDARFTLVDNLGDIFEMPYLPGGLHHFGRNNVYETLLVHDAAGNPTYNIGSSVQADVMQQRWTITLKPGVRFSDGTLLDAEIVKDSWIRNIEECGDSACVMQWVLKDIEEIQVVDSLTLRIYLNTPRSNFKEHLTAACFHIAKESAEHRWRIGTGPYVIANTGLERAPARITYRRNPYYHHGEASLEEVTIIRQQPDIIDYVTGRNNTGALIKQPREIDFFGAIEALKDLKAFNKKIYFLALNPGSPRLSAVSARARIVRTFDRQAVLTVVTGARSEVAASFFTDIDTSIGQPEASSTSRISNTLRILYLAQDPVAEQIAQRLAVRLQHEGIPAQRPEGISRDRLKRVRLNRQYDILVDSVLPFFSTPAYNMYDLLDRGFIFDDDLAEKAGILLTSGGSARVADVEKHVAEQYYLYPLIRTSFHMVVPRKLHDVQYSGGILLDFSRAWFQK